MGTPSIVWFHQNLRLRDNPALFHAASKGPILPVFIFDEKRYGSAQKVWLYHALKSLEQKLGLLILKQDPLEALLKLQKQTGAKIFHNKGYDPQTIEIASGLENHEEFASALLLEPEDISPKTGGYFKVFTPFWKTALKLIQTEKPLPIPEFTLFKHSFSSCKVEDLQLLPKICWHKGIENYWEISEESAHKKLQQFLEKKVNNYKRDRDFPAISGTSELSAYLHFGQISPKQIWYACQNVENTECFLSELGWREFSYHLLYHFPKLVTEAFNPKFNHFSWDQNEKAFSLWTKGLSGYPIVDAGMRQLYSIGWMHNRVRMITASFLTKDLLIPWQKGAQWLFDTLVDADLANNSASWQWVAGSGADAAPYFRIFNPSLQSARFDPEGLYIKKWVPELKNVSAKLLHDPQNLDVPGYPKPIVDHKKAKDEAMKRFKAL